MIWTSNIRNIKCQEVGQEFSFQKGKMTNLENNHKLWFMRNDFFFQNLLKSLYHGYGNSQPNHL